MQANILNLEKFISKKNRRIILREEKLKEGKKKEKKKKKEKLIDIRKIKEGELLREVIVKIRLKRIDIQEEIVRVARWKSKALQISRKS